MCAVSMVSDGYIDQFPARWPTVKPIVWPGIPLPYTIPLPPPDRAEFDKLKREVDELRKLIEAAQRFDEATGQPECEAEDKADLIRKLAKYVGVEINL